MHDLVFRWVVKKKLDPISGTSDYGDRKIQNVIVSDEQGDYPNVVVFSFGTKQQELVEWLEVGDTYDFHYNFSTKETEKGAFTSIRAWRVEWTKQSEKDSVDDDLPF